MIVDNSYVTIDLDAIAANYRAVQEKAGVPAMAVIKADAYGHGAVQVAKHLQSRCGFFGVASVQEALELRNAGINTPILVFGRIPAGALTDAVRAQIRPTIFRYADAVELSRTAQALGMEAPFHLAVDTGMSRIGFQVTQADAEECARCCRLPGLIAEGIFSQYAAADADDLTKARLQAEKFDAFYAMLQAQGIQVQLRHMDNSAGVMNFDRHYDMVRAGIVLYGMYPSSETDPRQLSLQPAMNWYGRIAHVKTLAPGREVGYGGTFTVTKPTVVATVSVGYADGYGRALGNRFYVLIRGKKAPVLGKVCMDQIMVDVTDIPGVDVDDWVVLMGRDGEQTITAEEIGEAAASFHYAFVCGISRRVPRYYLQNGKIVHQVHYLLDK